jgi:two-component system, NarL family, sensor histidine kinase UhpB
MSLLQRVVLADALLVFAAVALLVLSPVTVSRTATGAEVAILLLGAAVLLTVTTVMTRRSLAPLRGLAALMGRADPASGRHAPIPAELRGPTREVADLAAAFDAMLTRLEDERRGATRLAIDAQEAERARLARELHDEVAQTLTAVTLQLQAAEGLKREALAARLTAAREALHAGSDAVREIMRGLRPEALEDFGLRAAVVALASSSADRAGIRVRRRRGAARHRAGGRARRLPRGAGGAGERRAARGRLRGPCRARRA